jgi:photosystem II stability/assembly factor-like uncharacterized protein
MFRRLALALATSALALLPAGVATANLRVGATGWWWGNPLPQGHPLDGVSFAGTTGYAVGLLGELLKSEDGGSTWTTLRGPDLDPSVLSSAETDTYVQALSQRDVVLAYGCALRRSSDGGATFTASTFPGREDDCATDRVWFATPAVGYVTTADGVVYATTDGGAHFARRSVVPGPVGHAFVSAMRFTDAATGLVSRRDKLYRTTDAGSSWQLVATGGQTFTGLTFVDASHGYAYGDFGLLLATDDGGATWAHRPITSKLVATGAVDCASATVCLVLGISGRAHSTKTVLYTTDGGATARPVRLPAGTTHVAFASPTRGVAAGDSGAIAISDDAGATFHRIGTRLPGRYRTIRAGTVRGAAFALGDAGALAATTDGGQSWHALHVPTTARLLDVAFPTAANGWVLDAHGTLLRTTNGGKTWRGHATGARARALAVRGRRELLLIGPRGIRRSTDGGSRWQPIRDPAVAAASLAGVALSRGRTLVIWGRSTLVTSTDGGRSWTTIPLPEARLLDTAFVSRTTGYVVDTTTGAGAFAGGGALWRTRDGGRHWAHLYTLTDVTHVEVGPHRTVETTASDGVFGIMHSADGGASWATEFLGPKPDIAIGHGAAYALLGNSSLLATTDGGVGGARTTLALRTRRRRLPRPTTVVVSGRLRPMRPGAEVGIAVMPANAATWDDNAGRLARLAPDGSFTTRVRVRRGTTRIAAAWLGDATSTGMTSRVLTIVVGARRSR